jgi:hypothetical protein
VEKLKEVGMGIIIRRIEKLENQSPLHLYPCQLDVLLSFFVVKEIKILVLYCL